MGSRQVVKTLGFDPSMRRFESSLLSQNSSVWDNPVRSFVCCVNTTLVGLVFKTPLFCGILAKQYTGSN